MIEGLDKLLKRIERYENVSTVQGVRKGIALVQAQARAGCISETGELRNSIHVSDEVIGKNKVVGSNGCARERNPGDGRYCQCGVEIDG